MAWNKINLFAAWVFIAQTLAGGWIAAIGQTVLELLGHQLHIEALPCRMIGFLLLILSVLIIQHYRPIVIGFGNCTKPTYQAGHRLISAANVLATSLFIYPFFTYLQVITHPDLIMVLSKFTVAGGYLAIGMWAMGIPLVYQSSLPDDEAASSK